MGRRKFFQLFKHISLGDVIAFIADYFANGSNAYQKATCYLSVSWRLLRPRVVSNIAFGLFNSRDFSSRFLVLGV